jgi:hypothetical protein
MMSSARRRPCLAAKGPEERFISWDAGVYGVESQRGVLVSTATETSEHQLPPPPWPDAIHRLAASPSKNRSSLYGDTIQSARQEARSVVAFPQSVGGLPVVVHRNRRVGGISRRSQRDAQAAEQLVLAQHLVELLRARQFVVRRPLDRHRPVMAAGNRATPAAEAGHARAEPRWPECRGCVDPVPG